MSRNTNNKYKTGDIIFHDKYGKATILGELKDNDYQILLKYTRFKTREGICMVQGSRKVPASKLSTKPSVTNLKPI